MRGISGKYSVSVATICLATLMATSARAALVISSDATSNVSCDSGVCSATAADAVLNVYDLTNMLAAGSLTVQSGSQAQDILVEAPFSWTSSNALTLDSFRKITVDQPVSDAGPAALNMLYNDGGAGGELLFRHKGRISFTSTKNKLAINGQKYTLLSDIASMASAIAGNPTGSYALKDNYDASKDGSYSLPPIPTNFGGTFEGLGNTISNLSIDCERDHLRKEVGLFSSVYPSSGAIKSLRLENISYSVKSPHALVAGGLVGSSAGYLFDDHVSGSIIAKVGVGGLTGGNVGTVSNSSAEVKISGKTSIDGEASGGLVGGNEGTIISSYDTGSIKAPASAGLVGDNEGAVTNSYARGRVKGGSTNWVGGFGGINESGGTITASYSTGKVTAKSLFGGFGGAINGEGMSDDYWDTKTSGTTNGVDSGNVAGITGLTTKQFKKGLPDGFDPSVWAQDPKINDGYPYLIDNPPSE